MSEFDPMQDVDDPLQDHPQYIWGDSRINGHLWVISYSDFMTILMIFFLMLFAHRVWEKKMSWEAERVSHLRAVQESQRGMVQRLSRLTTLDVAAERINIHLPDALLFDAGAADLRPSAQILLHALAPELRGFYGRHHCRRPYRRFASGPACALCDQLGIIRRPFLQRHSLPDGRRRFRRKNFRARVRRIPAARRQ